MAKAAVGRLLVLKSGLQVRAVLRALRLHLQLMQLMLTAANGYLITAQADYATIKREDKKRTNLPIPYDGWSLTVLSGH